MKEDLTEKESNRQIVHVRQGNSGTLICPRCETSYRVDPGQVKTRGELKVKCKCGHVFAVFFELREYPRRELPGRGFCRRIIEVHVRGSYRKSSSSESFRRMQVKNISRTGIGFVVPTGHNLKVGDRIEVMFKLDDAESTRMERSAIVRRVVEENYLGCEFIDIGHVDKDTGFYVMS